VRAFVRELRASLDATAAMRLATSASTYSASSAPSSGGGGHGRVAIPGVQRAGTGKAEIEAEPAWATVLSAWVEAEATCELNPPVVVPVPFLGRGWRTVWLFVSSTFVDMHAERELIVKHVVPAVRAWAEPLRLHVVECDLRWGVVKDTPAAQTLSTGLGENDRCREENGGCA